MEKQILDLFLYNHRLKFSDIEKKLNARSNKLAYHIKRLVSKGVLIKENNAYLLSESSECLIPYLSDKKSVLPIILIKIGSKKSCFLYKRDKRPFKNYLSLPGGRLILGESIKQAVKRIMFKFGINAALEKITSINLEHIKKSGKIINSFLLILVQAKTKDKVKLININQNKNKIISSDYHLIKQKNKEIKIPEIFSKD